MSIDSSWTDYMDKQAPRGILCQFSREGGKPWVGMRDDFSPEFNVAGLYWRLTGIGREQTVEAMLPTQRRVTEAVERCIKEWRQSPKFGKASESNYWRDLLGGQG